MKLLWIVDRFPPQVGGVQRYSYNTIAYLKLFKGIVLCNRNYNIEEFEIDSSIISKGHKVVRSTHFKSDNGPLSIIRHMTSWLGLLRQILTIERNEKLDIIVFGHCSFFYLYMFPFLKLLLNKPICLIFHGEDIPIIPLKSNGLMRRLIDFGDHFFCNSEFTAKRLNKFCKKKIKNFIAYPGVTEDFFTQFDKIGQKNKVPTIYTMARLDKRKGHDLVIEALPLIKKKIPNIMYRIGGEGPALSYLKELANKYDVDSNVAFEGLIHEDDVKKFHLKGDIFVMPNRTLNDGDTEGFGITFLEAGAAGKPVIGGHAGGAIEAIADGVTGYLVDPKSIEDIANKIIFLFEHYDIMLKYGNAGQKRASEEFSWPFLINKFENELRRFI